MYCVELTCANKHPCVTHAKKVLQEGNLSISQLIDLIYKHIQKETNTLRKTQLRIDLKKLQYLYYYMCFQIERYTNLVDFV